jgi:hypothetical protein
MKYFKRVRSINRIQNYRVERGEEVDTFLSNLDLVPVEDP